jgi:hypothetical protein
MTSIQHMTTLSTRAVRSVRIASGWMVLLLAAGTIACGDSRAPLTAPSPLAINPVAPLPVGTVFMRGTVSDTAFRSLARATIEVLDGPQTGMTAIASDNGEFALSGIFDDDTRFRATKAGYVTSVRTLQPFCARCNPNRWINFSLEVLAAPVNMAGDYRVTFAADADSCPAAFPRELLTRTYEATIAPAPNAAPANAYAIVPLSGAMFFWNDLSMGIAGNYVGFWLETIVEQLSPTTFLTFAGLAAASLGASPGATTAFPFDGTIGFCRLENGATQADGCFKGGTQVACISTRHQLIFNRR